MRIACDDIDLVSDVFCSVCGAWLDYGSITWMDMEHGTMYCPTCCPPVTQHIQEFVVIEWLHERGTSVLHRVRVMELDKWR